jgi:chaperonin GroES
VMAVGPGRVLDSGDRVAMDLKEGDRVLFAKYAGTEFKHEDSELLILSEKDVLGVMVSNGK